MKVVNTKKTAVNSTLSMLMNFDPTSPKPVKRDQHNDSKPFVSFTQKLYEMVSDSQVYAIHWNSEGDGFQVADMTTLCNTVFPHYFKHNSWPSFTRQLNMYGFTRIGGLHASCDNSLEFKHPHFLKASPHLLRLIQRRVVSATSTTESRHGQSNSELISHVELLRNTNQQLTTQLHEQECLLLSHERTMNRVSSALSKCLESSHQPELVEALRQLQSNLRHSHSNSNSHSNFNSNSEPHPSISSPLTDPSVRVPIARCSEPTNINLTLPSLFNNPESPSTNTTLPCLLDILNSTDLSSAYLSHYHL